MKDTLKFFEISQPAEDRAHKKFFTQLSCHFEEFLEGGKGTEIFDQVADDLIDINYEWTGYYEELMPSIVINPLKNLHQILSDLDWDNEDESKYWEHPVIGRILGNTFEDEE